MAAQRFSPKEQQKQHIAKPVVPSDYEPLAAGTILKETEKAFLLKYRRNFGRYVEDESTYQDWIPKQHAIQNEYGVWCLPRWLANKISESHQNRF